MTERRVIPGRIFTPSTLHDREGLLLQMIAVLLATVPATSDDGLRRDIESVARNEHALPEADRSLRNVLHELDRFSKVLETRLPQLDRGIRGLNPRADVNASVVALSAIVGETVAIIQGERFARLKERPVDSAKLERIRAGMEGAILKAPAGIKFFREFTIETVLRRAEDAPLRFSLIQLNKAQLVEPPMESESLNLPEALARVVQERAASRVLELFNQRPREIVDLQGQSDTAFWHSVSNLADRLGPEPIMLVSRSAEDPRARRLLHGTLDAAPDLTIQRKPRDDGRGAYIATVEGIEVYGVNLQPGTAWLFSARSLRTLYYAILDDEGRCLILTYEPTDDTRGTLEVQFVQTTEWEDGPIFEVRSDGSTLDER